MISLSIPSYEEKMFSSECYQCIVQYDSPFGPPSDEWLYLDCIVFGLISVDTHDSFYFVLQSPCSTQGIPEFHFGKLVIACPQYVYCSIGPCQFAGTGEVEEEIMTVTEMKM